MCSSPGMCKAYIQMPKNVSKAQPEGWRAGLKLVHSGPLYCPRKIHIIGLYWYIKSYILNKCSLTINHNFNNPFTHTCICIFAHLLKIESKVCILVRWDCSCAFTQLSLLSGMSMQRIFSIFKLIEVLVL